MDKWLLFSFTVDNKRCNGYYDFNDPEHIEIEIIELI